MSTQANQLADAADWKDRYRQVRNEYQSRQQDWSRTQGELYKNILRLLFSYSGAAPILDEKLSAMRERLRKEKDQRARSEIIDPMINEVLQYSREAGSTRRTGAGLQELLRHLEPADSLSGKIEEFSKRLAACSSDADLESIARELAHLLNRADGRKAEKADRDKIELAADDPLTQLLENLSLPGETGAELLALRKRAREIEEEQERLQLIQDLVQLLTSTARGNGDGNKDSAAFPHLRETLLELFEWLSIPAEYKKRVDHVRNRISRLQADEDLSAVLRDTAIVINDLQEALQSELGDIQGFLARVTLRLEDVEDCFRELEDSDTEALKQTKQLNENIEDNIRSIRDGMDETGDVNEMKRCIESRLNYIEQSVSLYSQSSETRKQAWETRIATLNKQLESMKGETARLQERIHEEHKKAKTDALTGIPNRLAYNEKIKQEFARFLRNGQPLSLCVIDVDKFKYVNDTWGHKAGDKVLRTIADVCAGNIRQTDFFARYGGEEFVLVLPETEPEQALQVAESLRSKVELRKFHYASEPVPVTISCGIATMREGDDPGAVFKRADRAMYSAKQNGRNQVRSGD